MNPQQFRHFVDFAYFDRLAGGPDSHMATVGELIKLQPIKDRQWRVGVYVAVYNVPTAVAIWNRWPTAGTLLADYDVEGWLTENWPAIATRRERRSVRTPAQLATCLRSYAEWTQRGLPPNNYEAAWLNTDQLYGFGRYAKIKLLEALHRYVGSPAERIPDLRAKDGWSPREGLALIFPNYGAQLVGESQAVYALADQLSEELRAAADELGTRLDRYEMQVFLCDYKQAWHGRQYPGRSLDSELEYASIVSANFDTSEMFEARRVLFNPLCLGEVTGRWKGVRKELGSLLPTLGVTWSDTVYDYANSIAPWLLVKRT